MLLPEPFQSLFVPVFAACPPDRAFCALVATGPPSPFCRLVEGVLAHPELQGRRDLAAGLWLLVDDFHAVHEAVNGDPSPSGAWWHAILHRREGDFANARYWYQRAAHHPALPMVNLSGGTAGAGSDSGSFNPEVFVDHVERHLRSVSPPADLLSFQRMEWIALFRWCCENG